MPLQDLTPQLRTRLNKMERAVGWFVFLASALLLSGFVYYLYHTAERKGWFLVQARFYTYVNSATGLTVGDPVVLMGFQVGQITRITAMPPRTPHNVRIDFDVRQENQNGQPYYGYVWSEGSIVKLNSTDFLGKRGLEITRGTNGFNAYTTRRIEWLPLDQAEDLADPTNWRYAQNILDANSNVVVRAWTPLTNLTALAGLKIESVAAFHIAGKPHRRIASMWDAARQRYQGCGPTNSYELCAAETPAIADQLQAIVLQVQQALPNVLALTNKLASVLDNAAQATSNLNTTIVGAQPLITDFTAIAANLRGPGALGVWALGANAPFQLASALTNANTLLVNVDTNLDQLTGQVGRTLDNVANITSNLDSQVQANSNMLGAISKTVVDADTFIQGLKRHWLLRSAFKTQASNQPPVKYQPPPKTK